MQGLPIAPGRSVEDPDLQLVYYASSAALKRRLIELGGGDLQRAALELIDPVQVEVAALRSARDVLELKLLDGVAVGIAPGE